MDRLIASSSVPLASADTAPATGTPQYATDGNPVTSTPATLFPAYAWNAIQDEIMNVILGAGLTPNRNAWNQLLTAIQTMLQGSTTNVAADTGAANAYVVAFTPALTEPIPWVPFWIKIAHANTGASTLNATGTVEPFVGGAHLALQGGELIANGNALVYWNPTLASGAGSYVLLFCSGAPEQIAAATASQHAVQLGQVTSTASPLPLATAAATLANQAVNLGQFSGSLTYIKFPNGEMFQWGVVTGSNSFSGTLGIAFPTVCNGFSATDTGATRNSYGGVGTTTGFTIYGPSAAWTAQYFAWGK